MNGCQTCGGFGMHHDPIAHGWDGEEAQGGYIDADRLPELERPAPYVIRPRKAIHLHSVYPDGAHAVDCEGCREKIAAILREWVYDHGFVELPDAPGEIADRILDALAVEST